MNYKMLNIIGANLQGLCELAFTPVNPHHAIQAKFGTSAMLSTKSPPANLGKS